MSARKQVRVSGTKPEKEEVYRLLVGLGKKEAYAYRICFESGVYYALTSEEAKVFLAGLKLLSLQHVVKVW